MRSRLTFAVLPAVLGVLGLAITAVDQLQPISDADFFWHLKTGEWIWQHQALPTADPFAYPTPATLDARQRFTLTSYWLSQIAYHLLATAGGFPAIVLLRFLIVGLLVAVILPQKRGDTPLFAGMLVLALVGLGMFPLERPQAFSFVLYAALLGLLGSLREPAPSGRRRLAVAAAVPALMLLWANTHGAFLLGQVTIVLVLGCEGLKFFRQGLQPLPAVAYRRLLLVGALGLIFSFANPNTYHAIEYLRPGPEGLQAANIEYQSTVSIFTSLSLYRVAVFWAVLLLAALGFAASWRRPDITAIALLAGLGAASFFRSRYVPFFLVAAVPVAAAGLSVEVLRKWARAVVVGLAAVAALYFASRDRSTMVEPPSGGWVDRYFPEEEADFIVREGLQGRMYNNPNWGGYLMWRLAPQRKVFSDGRGLDQPSYLATVVIDNARGELVFGVPAWKRLLDTNGIQYVITPLFGRGVLYPLVNALLRDDEWHLVFSGYNSLIFVRSSPENGRVILSRGQPKELFLDDMIEWYTRRSAQYPGNMFLHLTRGELLVSRRRFAEARAAYARVLELAPFNAIARERLRTLP
jgi:hypothetical protein